MSQLPVDCLKEIFEYLEDEKVTLHSCLLVNRLCCQVAVEILWRNSRNYNYKNFITLIACLPNESKEILHSNGIIISTSTSTPPIFNYASFCKNLSISIVSSSIRILIQRQQFITTQGTQEFDDYVCVLEQEIFKLFMNQISSLKCLSTRGSCLNINSLTICLREKDCLKYLSELDCTISNKVSQSEFFNQLSQICHNLLSLRIVLFSNFTISNGLTDLMAAQKNLKYLHIYTYCDIKKIVPSLTKNPITLTKFSIIYRIYQYMPLSFITKFTNLQELVLSSRRDYLENFKTLQYVTFSQLRILRIYHACEKYEFLINFIEINGKNLREIHIGNGSSVSDNSLNLAIAKFCPNLRKLSVGFKSDELETLKIVFNSCQYLESINIWCSSVFLSEKNALEMVAKYSPKNFCELKLDYRYRSLQSLQSELTSEELESCFTSWANRMPQKSFSLIISHRGNNYARRLDLNVENKKIIDKYIKLGVIKKFSVE